MLTAIGPEPTEIAEPIKALLVVSMTETVPPPSLVTYTLDPSGETETPKGLLPTPVTVEVAPVATVTTVTVPAVSFATYALVPSGVMAIPRGPVPVESVFGEYTGFPLDV